MYMSTNNFLHVPLGYFPIQTRLYRLKGATYNAIVQESAILYIHGSEVYILAKNCRGRWSAFLCHFAFFVSRHHSAWFKHVQPLTYTSKRVFGIFLQES